MPSWQIPVICICLFLVFMSIGLIGGVCEYMLCTRRNRAAVHDAADLDFGCRGTPSGSPQIGSDQSTLIGDKLSHETRVKEEEELGRYSWQDDKGITTEVYMDGKIPGAGPCATPRKTVSRAQNGRYEAVPSTSDPTKPPAVQRYRGNQFMVAGDVVSPISPEEAKFAVHDEQDDLEYQKEMAGQPGGLVGYYGAYATTLGPATSPATEEEEPMGARSMPWQDHGMLSPVRRENYRGDSYEGVHGGEGCEAARYDEAEGKHGQSMAEFKPWLPTVDLTIDDEPLHEITLRDREAESGSRERPSVEGMWKTHPTQFL